MKNQTLKGLTTWMNIIYFVVIMMSVLSIDDSGFIALLGLGMIVLQIIISVKVYKLK